MHEMNFRKHWETIRLEEIADIRAGSAFPIKYQGNVEGKYPFYKVSDMNLTGNETLMHASNNWVEEDTVKTLKAKSFPKDTVIFPKVGAAVHTNKKRLLSCNSLVDNNVMGVTIRDYDLCIPYYLLYWFEFIDLGDLSNPGPLPAITATTVKNTIIPLPPLLEQRAIADILQTLQEAKFARQREVALEREHKAALMDFLFSHGMRGEPRKQTEIGEIPESWEVVKLEKLYGLIQYGTSRRCNTDKNGVPVLRIPNIVGGKVDIVDLKFIEPSEREFQNLSLEVGDMLFVRTNGRKEYAGRCAVFQGEFQESLFASYLIRVRMKPDTALPEFVQLYTTTSKGCSYLSGRASTAADGKFNINTQTIKSVLLPVPASSEQREIVETCRTLDTKITVLEQEVELMDELFHAMLDELMTGQRSAVPLIDALR